MAGILPAQGISISVIGYRSAAQDAPMPAISIQNLSEETHRALKSHAMRNGRSIEAEIREILDAAVRPAKRVNSARLSRRSDERLAASTLISGETRR